MPRVYVPEIPDEIVNLLTTPESTLEWIKRLEVAQKRLEEELMQVKMVLKYVVYPKFNQFEKDKVASKKELEIDSLRNILEERKERK
jgi:hypothetical protein